jgi:predicted acyltransferase (DUF342 family)
MLFKVTNKDNRGNSLFIQGSYSRSTSNDVSSVTFQNYDDDSRTTHNIARIAARDAYGSCNENGYGEMLLMTSGDGSNLSERMRIKSGGYICMGTTEAINNSLLSVNGSTSISTDLDVGNNMTISSNVTISNELHVIKDVTINGNLTTSNLYVHDDVDIFGAANVRNRLTVYGGLVVKRTNILPSSEITLFNNFSSFENNEIQGTLDDSSNVTFGNTFNVLGNVIFHSNLDLFNNFTVGGNAVFENSVIFSQSFNVSNDITVNGNATVHSALIVNSNAIVGKDTILAGNLNTMSNVTLGASASSNVITLNGRSTVNVSHNTSAFTINQTGSGHLFSIQKNGTNKIVALSNGNFGIGTSNPTKVLEVVGDVNFIGDIYQNNNPFQPSSHELILSFSKIKETSKTYKSLISWINNSKSVDSLYVKSFLTANNTDNTSSSNFNYNLRVYDSTNNKTLHISTHSNQTPSNLFLTLSNVTSNALITMELHSKVGTIGNYVCLETVLLNYN